MKNSLHIFAFSALCFFANAQKNYTAFVNPFIGTGGHGHTFPGATTPFGMVQVSPDTRIDDSWDGCSGYYYSDPYIYGFSQTHLNGTGCSDYGDMRMMPTMGVSELKPELYRSGFQHNTEKASPGYYKVHLDRFDIDAELTSSPRVGFQKYTFHKDGTASIILDLNHRDKLVDGEVKIIDDKTIEVYRRSDGWAKDQRLYAKIIFNQPVNIQLLKSDKHYPESELAQEFSGAIISKKVRKGEVLMAKIALSPTGYASAELNSTEIKDWDFGAQVKKSEKLWNDQLSKIEVQSADKNRMTIFYTALYHIFTQPNIYNDLDGKYRGRDNKVHTGNGDYYTVFSLWDTFRAYHPLMTLIDKKRTADFINTFLLQYEQGGALPVWELSANDTGTMIGYHAVPVIADAMMKGIKGFDYEKAFTAAKSSAMQDINGLDAYKKQFYIGADDDAENVSKTLEYAYDDWCIAQMAKLLHKNYDYQYFMRRSQSWKNLYNPKNGFMQARRNGQWFEPFNPNEINNNYTEGNAWQYSFFVPQDVPELIKYHGGKTNFEAFLDKIFTTSSVLTGKELPDVSGLIGQYAHGNEPSHQIAYLYNFVGRPEKTHQRIRYILDEFYKNAPDGLIGNEDCGQMSAWYVLSTMGIYAVMPGKPEWEATTPYFDNIKIHLEDGTTREISKNISPEKLRKLGFENIPTLPDENYSQLVAAPVLKGDLSFAKSTQLEIVPLNPNDKIYYQLLEGGTKNGSFKSYERPFNVEESSQLNFYAERNGEKSAIISTKVHRRENDWDITTANPAHPAYNAGGNIALIDGLYGTKKWKNGNWLGFYDKDLDAVIDLKKPQKIHYVFADFFQNYGEWIMMPKRVEFSGSMDGKNFTPLATVENTVKEDAPGMVIKKFEEEIPATTVRYLRVKAVNFGKLPQWHSGNGNPSFIFVDEIGAK